MSLARIFCWVSNEFISRCEQLSIAQSYPQYVDPIRDDLGVVSYASANCPAPVCAAPGCCAAVTVVGFSADSATAEECRVACLGNAYCEWFSFGRRADGGSECVMVEECAYNQGCQENLVLVESYVGQRACSQLVV